MKKEVTHIPIYGIDQFNRKTDTKIQFQIEIFDKNRDFKVCYPHRHDDFYEILYITKGKGTYTIDFVNYEIKPDSVFFLSPGQIHELEISDDIQGFIFLFTSAFYHFNKTNPYKLFELPFFYSFTDASAPLLVTEGTRKNYLSELFSNAIRENEQTLADKEEAVRALLDLLLIQCKRWYPAFASDEKTYKSKILVKRFKQLIEEKCQENVSIKEYAVQLNITPNHLSETVKLVTGRTASDLINDRMLMEIKRMLTHTQLSISEIAYTLNFSDQSYFSKYFKKLTGVSPKQFLERDA